MSNTNFRDEVLNREAAKAAFPVRQGYGQIGKRFGALANNYSILTLPAEPFYHYDDITTQSTAHDIPPKPVPRRLYKKIIVNMMTKNPQVFSKRGSFDGNRNLYVPRSLGIPDGQSTFLAAGVDGEEDSNQHPFRVKLTRVGKIEVKTLARLVLSGQQIINSMARTQALRDMSSALMVLNTVVQMVGKDLYRDEANRKSTVYFRPRRQLDSGARWLELWQGYYQSVRPTISRMTVNIDITHGLMFREGSLLDLVMSHLKKQDARDLVPSQIKSISSLEKLIKGLLVVVHRNQSMKTRPKPIMAVVTRGARDYMFTNRSGDHISVAVRTISMLDILAVLKYAQDYYRQTYHTTIRYPTIICVAVANKATVVPLELCHIVPGQLYKGTVPPEVTQMAVKTAATRPGVRLDAIKQAYRDLQYSNSDFIRQCGMTVDTNPMKLAGRRLEPPSLWFARREEVKVSGDSSFTLPGKKFFSPAAVESCGVLCFLSHRDRPDDMRPAVFDFCKRLCGRLRDLGMTGPGLEPENPRTKAFYIRQASQGGNVREYVQDVMKYFADSNGPRKPSLLVAIMPNPSDADQIAVKRIGDVELGFATQIVRTDKIVGRGLPKDDYLSNIASKINLKLGGFNWVLGKASLPGYNAENDFLPTSMIIGADVSHPPAHNTTSPSICGVVATLDEKLIRYAGISCVQMGGRRVETIHELKDMLKPLFKRFRARLPPIGNNPQRSSMLARAWPAQLIYYRDGVGETQLADVTHTEKQAILSALREVQFEMGEPDAPKPLITFIVVSKRHHQRFFPDHGDRNGNCFAGSVFDEGIASPVLFDFYLQSQAAIQGTARPAHYVVTHNENATFDCNSLQQFTYNMCHIYERATRSVSIPAPVYYADLLCRRAKFMFPPGMDFSDSASIVSGHTDEASLLQFYRSRYASLHDDQRDKMYFV
ncbi:Piwi-domain-containing protein [Auricularia subglabra TFB-10046 SS5]|nr:Piwi-domain-containing protein [Auricularia subglabra TFB-10046 SS5]